VAKKNRRTIAVLMHYGAGPWAVHRGIAGFARSQANWKLVCTTSQELLSLRARTGGVVDGLIIQDEFYDAHITRDALASGIPTVNTIQNPNATGIPTVCMDNFAIGKLAGEYLLSLGYRGLAYIQAGETVDSCYRRDGLLHAASAAGVIGAVGNFPSLWTYEPPAKIRQRVSRWIKSLKLPCGILVFCDGLGDAVISAVRGVGVRVPEDVAIIGVDDNEMLCEYCDPPLSSIDPNSLLIGYRAAEVLERMIDGDQPTPSQTLIPPLGVIERGSTESIAVDDDDVAKVLRLMRQRLGEPITLDEMAHHVRLSKRALQIKFKKSFGREPFAELMRLRIEYSKKKLPIADLSIANIAVDAGFCGPEHFCRAFKRHTGLTPSAYRRVCGGDV
jgi:LacI family transcriptional regulator